MVPYHWFIRELKTLFPEALQVWYTDDDAHAHSQWQKIKDHFQTLQIIGPAYGYLPEPSTKSILIVAPHRVEAANEFFAEFQFEEVTTRDVAEYGPRKMFIQN